MKLESNKIPLVFSARGDISKESIRASLKALQIQKGDSLFISTRLYVLGRLNLEMPRDLMLDSWIDAFFEAVGSEGTLIFPAYSGSVTKRETFHVQKTPTLTGVLNERFRLRFPLQRTACPMSSVVAVGRDADFFVKNVASNCLGKDSFFDRLCQRPQSKAVFVGGFVEFMTFAHHIEYRMKVPYRYDKDFPAVVIDERLAEGMQEQKMQHTFYCRDLSFGARYDHSHLKSYILKEGLLQEKPLGNSTISVIQTADLEKAIATNLKENPFFLIEQTAQDWERSPKDARPN